MRADLSLLSAVRASACRFSAKPALVSPERSITYAEFSVGIESLALTLLQTGLAPGDRVALLDTDSAVYFELFYAIGAAGLVAVPLNYRQRREELAYQLGDSGARLLLAGSRYEAEAEALAARLDFGWRPLLAFHGTAPRVSGAPLPPADPHAAFAICYTSGTTGRPKGATISQHAVCLRALKFVAEFGVRSDDTVHVTSPLFHISGLVLNLMGVVRGCTLLIMPQFRLADTLEAMLHHRISFICLVPTILAMIAESNSYRARIFESLRVIMYAGSPMNPALMRDVLAIYKGDMVQSFGQTEDLPQLILDAEAHRAALEASSSALDSVGRPALGVEIKICDEAGNRLADGEIGEIASRGGTGMMGYWNLPEATAETLRDGWVHSGDLGYIGQDGFVYLAGRRKQMIIRGGENVYPAEVERVLLAFPGVRDAAVIGLPDPVWGEIVVAVVVADISAADAMALTAFCKERLASYRCPERIIFREGLPYNAGGKVDRGQLRRDIESDE